MLIPSKFHRYCDNITCLIKPRADTERVCSNLSEWLEVLVTNNVIRNNIHIFNGINNLIMKYIKHIMLLYTILHYI